MDEQNDGIRTLDGVNIMFSKIFTRNAVIATLTAAGLLGAAMLTLDVDIHVKDARAATTPTKPGSSRDVYYPGTEELAADEMRVIACGTGMPMPRLKQAAACFVIELGNGDKFIFDMGNGSFERIHAPGVELQDCDGPHGEDVGLDEWHAGRYHRHHSV